MISRSVSGTQSEQNNGARYIIHRCSVILTGNTYKGLVTVTNINFCTIYFLFSAQRFELLNVLRYIMCTYLCFIKYINNCGMIYSWFVLHKVIFVEIQLGLVETLICRTIGSKFYVFQVHKFLFPWFILSLKVSSLGRYVFGSEISYNKPPPACLG